MDVSDLRNKDGFEESKRLDKGLIDQLRPYLSEAARPYITQLGGRDIDMVYTHRTMQIIVDFKRPEELRRERDDWYYTYREMAWKDNVVMCVCLEDRTDIKTISKVKLITKKWETGYRDCDFKHFMSLNKFFIDTAEKRNDKSYRKRLFNPKIADEDEYARFCKSRGIQYV